MAALSSFKFADCRCRLPHTPRIVMDAISLLGTPSPFLSQSCTRIVREYLPAQRLSISSEHMRAQKLVGWTVTGLMAGFILLSAIPDVLRIPAALDIMKHLGYPPYLLLFLGTAKMLGVLAVLVPGIPRIKEWAFAGLTFDVSGALYSSLSVGDPPSGWAPAVVALLLVGGSYV